MSVGGLILIAVEKWRFNFNLRRPGPMTGLVQVESKMDFGQGMEGFRDARFGR